MHTNTELRHFIERKKMKIEKKGREMVGRREIVSVSRIGVSSSHGAHCGFHASLGIDHVRLHLLLCAYQSSR